MMSPNYILGSWTVGSKCADCFTNIVTAFGGDSVMAWVGISLIGKTRLVIISLGPNYESTSIICEWRG